ncbi:MAG: alcohol dehydrogenase catalytic domain-containing protein, partial [Lachnospiraceae bacterium]|nr:alcohol dehydrogenase catalytic domain-containing protein [Lachnospiraceae bacterium]
GTLKVKEVPYPQIKKPSQLIIKVEAASICGSDIHGLADPPGQYMKPGIIYGHEFCGSIVEMGDDVEGFEIGELVAVNPRVRCGRCYECTHNKGDLCSNSDHYGQLADGGFAEYALVDAGQLYHVGKDVPAEIVAQVEPLACVVSALNKVKPSPMDYVILYGAGPIGLTFIRVLKAFGVTNLIVTAKGEDRVKEAKNCGADLVVDVEKEKLEDVVKANWPYKADVIIDAVGRGSVLEEAMQLINPQGRILLFGLDNNARSTISPGAIVLNEISLFGGLGKDFPGALELIKNPDLGLDQFITHRVSMDEIFEGIEAMRQKKACRVIVLPHKK